jgi:internalin A
MTVPACGFISYAHDDYALFQQFHTHLRATERRFSFDFWADTRLNPGHHWNAEISRRIDAADVFVLLVSADFISSDYIYTLEKPAIQARCNVVKGLILPVVLRRCAWELAAGVLQAAPTDGGRLKPVLDWHRRNNGYDRAREQIDKAIADHYGLPMTSP